MKLISSFDSTPIENNRWNNGNRFREAVFMTALSLLRASKFYDVVFYTTEKMAKCLKNLPIAIEVFKTSFDYAESDMWVESKFYAYSQQSAPFIHIDTDVILYEDVFKSLDFYDVLGERIEYEAEFSLPYAKQVHFFTKHLVRDNITWNSSLNYSINCGSVGFKNMEAKDDFVQNYFRLKEEFNKKRLLFDTFYKYHYEPCLVLEQYNLAALAKEKKYNLTTLLVGSTKEENQNLAKKKGYMHYAGNVKYNKDVINKVFKELAFSFRSYYKKINIE